MAFDKQLGLDILLKEHMALCVDDHDEIETILRGGCIGLEKMSETQIVEELTTEGLMDRYERELALKKGG